ncbi:MAG: DUF1624 domain-containing protein [Chloroflexi bacterium]|nr:DUF1624 domain-containing protein [Chloroflexota bacterium]
MMHKRLKAPDALRGLIMILMALDHANHFIAQKHSSGEYWGGAFPKYHDALSFLTRWITHLSAPGFFFLMGMGMWIFSQTRQKQGWSKWQVIRHFLIRGSILIALQFLVVNPAWGLSSGGWALEKYVGVLFALGGTMILGTILFLIPTHYLLPLTLIFLFNNAFPPLDLSSWGENFESLQRLSYIPGGDLSLWVNYPIFPWLPLVTLGMLFGDWLQSNKEKAYRLALWTGLLFLLLFIITRPLGNFWNIRPLPTENWTDFLSVVKYPPSLTFIFMTMGINLLLLWAFSRSNKIPKPLIIFGKTPLFFYITHLYLYAVLGFCFAPDGTTIPKMLPFWLLGLAILYPLNLWYARFKEKESKNSVFKFL